MLTHTEVALLKDASTISLTVLKNLIQHLSPEQLADLPADSLPDHVPMSLLENLDGRKRLILEDKLLAHQSHVLKIREVIRRELGATGLNAYDLAQQNFSTAHIEQFSDRFKEYQAFKKYFNLDAEENGAQRLLNMLAREQETARDMEHDYMELLRARKTLTHAALPDQAQQRVDRALGQLDKLITLHQDHLSQYVTERLALTVKQMSDIKQLIVDSRPDWEKVRLRIAADSAGEETGLLSEAIQHRSNITDGKTTAPKTLKEQVLALQLPYSESDLTDWMDCVLDYFLYFHERVRSDTLFAKARKYLMYLMDAHFENNALESHHFLHNLSEEKMADTMREYHQRSREYVENYFQERAGDLMEQMRETLFH